MSINKKLLAIALTLAATGCSNQAQIAQIEAAEAARNVEPSDVKVDRIRTSEYGGSLRRVVDSSNNVACYTFVNAISCVKLDAPQPESVED